MEILNCMRKIFSDDFNKNFACRNQCINRCEKFDELLTNEKLKVEYIMNEII